MFFGFSYASLICFPLHLGQNDSYLDRYQERMPDPTATNVWSKWLQQPTEWRFSLYHWQACGPSPESTHNRVLQSVWWILPKNDRRHTCSYIEAIEWLLSGPRTLYFLWRGRGYHSEADRHLDKQVSSRNKWEPRIYHCIPFLWIGWHHSFQD